MSDEHVLDNLAWHALTSTHIPFALGAGQARRYAPEVSVFGAIEHHDAAAWRDLADASAGDRVVLLSGTHGEPPRGWTRHGGGFGDQMVLAELAPAPAVGATVRELRLADVPAMVALVDLAQPGPFERRTIELGGYVGAFEHDMLIAMAGHRMQTPEHVEISAVCTHPSARGRGLAAALTHRVAQAIRAEGRRPLLHVAHGNDNAKRLYERLGFVVRRVVRVDAVVWESGGD